MVMIVMIKYLLKFVSCDKYAQDFIDGNLHMCAAEYYHNEELEKGQTDIMEGACSSNSLMYKNADYPIFCMYYINENEIKSSKIYINKQMIKDFPVNKGFTVIVPYKPFVNLLDSLKDVDGFSWWAGKVTYGFISLDYQKRIVSENLIDNLFIKRPLPQYIYQNEYRIVIGQHLHPNLKTEIVNGQKINVLDSYGEKEYFHVFPQLFEIATKVNISELTLENDYYVLNEKRVQKDGG